MRVLKFGGTSVADAAAIHRVVSIVARPGGAAVFAVVVNGADANALVVRLHDWFSAGASSASAGGAR